MSSRTPIPLPPTWPGGALRIEHALCSALPPPPRLPSPISDRQLDEIDLQRSRRAQERAFDRALGEVDADLRRWTPSVPARGRKVRR